MNYRTIISFLATKQQKTWGKPAPEWVNCKKSDTSDEWTDEFSERYGIRQKSRCIFPFYAIVNDAGNRMTFSTSGGTTPEKSYKIWACDEKVITLILTSSRAYEQRTLDAIKSNIEELDKEEIKKLCRENKLVEIVL